MKVLTIIWKIWFSLLTSLLVILIGFFWVYPFSLNPKTFPIAYKGIRLWAVLVFYGSGFRLEIDKKLKLDPQQSYLFVSNHTSIIDIWVMAIIHKKHPIVFVGKEELVKIPLFGTIYKRICILVNRQDKRSKMRVFRLAKEKINLGNSIVIFPEGGIPDDTSIVLDKFKDGAFTIAISTGLPIAVYSFKGLKEMFPFQLTKGYPGKVKVELLDIIETKDLSLNQKDEIKQIVFDRIQRSLLE